MIKKIVQAVTLILLVIVLLPVIKEFWLTFKWMTLHLKPYMWFFIGFGAYFVLMLIPPVKKNEDILQITSHEITHLIVALLFFKKIISREVTKEGGVVWYSGRKYGELFISLAPYTLPIFTFFFLLLRIIGAWESLYIFDVLIGFTLAFHCLCFIKQTRPYQTDISSNGYLLSYLFIVCFLLFNMTIILLSIRKGIIKANLDLFPNYWKDLLEIFKHVF